MNSSEEENRIKHLERLLEISRNLNATLELDPLLNSIIQAAQELIRCEASSILMYDESTDALKFVAAPAAHKPILQRIKVPLHKSVAGQVYQQCQPMIVRNGSNSPAIYRHVDRQLPFETRDLLAVPLLFRDNPVGVIEAINKENGDPFTDNDIQTLVTLASHAATAIQNAKLLKEIQKAYTELEELDRLKSDFISIASHELRTPLGLILGHAANLRETCDSKTVQERMSVIEKSALRLKRIIEDLDHIDRYQQGQVTLQHRTIIIAELLQELLLKFDDKSQVKNISLCTELKNSNLELQGDKKKIMIILSNLLDNAIAFTPKGGKVLICVEQISDFLKFSVIDSGIGISAEDLPHVFDRFYQVEHHMTRKHGGLGLGLSVAKTMVELHGGEIWAQSVEGKGSNFSFLLPISPHNTGTKQQVFL